MTPLIHLINRHRYRCRSKFVTTQVTFSNFLKSTIIMKVDINDDFHHQDILKPFLSREDYSSSQEVPILLWIVKTPIIKRTHTVYRGWTIWLQVLTKPPISEVRYRLSFLLFMVIHGRFIRQERFTFCNVSKVKRWLKSVTVTSSCLPCIIFSYVCYMTRFKFLT